MRRYRLAAALFTLCCTANTKGQPMKAIEQKIKQTAHTELDWKVDEMRVDEVPELKRGPCTFYTAAHTVRPIPTQPNYAVLAGDTVIGSTDPAAVKKILAGCGADAPASWQAEIVARFDPSLGGVVLQDETKNGGAVRKLRSAGVTFSPPKLADKTLSFFMLDPEAFIVSSVKAVRQPDGSVAVEKSPAK